MLGGETVIIVRPAGTDPYGDPLPGDPAQTTVPGCSVQPRSTIEQTDQRDTTTTLLTAWLPPGADITATDRLLWRGVTHEVDGQPLAWNDETGAAHHIEVPLRLIDG